MISYVIRHPMNVRGVFLSYLGLRCGNCPRTFGPVSRRPFIDEYIDPGYSNRVWDCHDGRDETRIIDCADALPGGATPVQPADYANVGFAF